MWNDEFTLSVIKICWKNQQGTSSLLPLFRRGKWIVLFPTELNPFPGIRGPKPCNLHPVTSVPLNAHDAITRLTTCDHRMNSQCFLTLSCCSRQLKCQVALEILLIWGVLYDTVPSLASSHLTDPPCLCTVEHNLHFLMAIYLTPCFTHISVFGPDMIVNSLRAGTVSFPFLRIPRASKTINYFSLV